MMVANTTDRRRKIAKRLSRWRNAAFVGALVSGGCDGGDERLAPTPPPLAATACVHLIGEPVLLSPRAGDTRHHPTVDVRPDGTILVAWQLGKAASMLGVASFSPQLDPLSGEVLVVSDPTHRPTHPQILADVDGGWLVWQQDTTGAILMTLLGPDMTAQAEVITLHPGGDVRKGLYPDLAPSGGGPPVALWYGGHEPSAAWTHRQGEGVPSDLPVHAHTEKGGPASLAVDGAGEAWAAWGEQDIGWFSRETTLRVGLVRTRAAVDVVTSPGRHERTALSFGAAGSAVLAWTRYPVADMGWSARAVFLGPDGTPNGLPIVPGDGHGHMIDAAADEDVAVLVWQQVVDQGTDILLQPWSISAAAPLCPAVTPHPPRAAAQARPSVHLRRGPDGELEGVVVWHAATAVAGVSVVVGRRFAVHVSRP